MTLYEYVISVNDQFSDNMRELLRGAGYADMKIEQMRRTLLSAANGSEQLSRTWVRLRGVAGRTYGHAIEKMAQMNDHLRRAGGPVDRLQSWFRRMGNSAENAFRSIIAKGREMNRGMQNNIQAAGRLDSMFGRLKRTVGTFLAVGAFTAFSHGAIQTAADMNSLENSVIAASKSMQEGRANLEFLQAASENMGLDLRASITGFKTLAGATRGTILQGEKTRKIFEAVSMASSVMGLSAEQSEGALLALGQMMGKGRVSAEELRGQLGERIPGAVQIAARAMGVTTAEFEKLMQAGLDATVFLPRFANQLRKEFASQLPRAAESMRANLNRINNEMLLFRQDFGREFTPLLAPFLSAMRNTFSWISANVFPVFQRLIDFTLAFSEQVHLLNPDLRNLKNAFLPLGDSIRSTLQEMGLMNEKTSTAGLLIATLSVGISKVVPLLQKMVSWTGKVIRFLGKNVVWLKRALKLYVAARVGILAYNLALKAQTVLLPVLRGATFAYNAAMLVATRGIRGATLAMQAFNVATKLNPLGLVVGLLATAAVSFVSFGNTVDDITAKQRSFNRELIKTNQLLQTGEQVAARTLMGEDVAQLSLQEIRAGMQSLNENIERFKPATIDFGMIGARAVEQDAADLRNLVANRNRLQAELDRRNRLLDAEGAGTIESPEVTEGIDNITGGGGRVVNVNVSGVKFAENIEINVTSLEEGEDLEEQMREWFVRVLNGGIYTGTQ